MKLIDLMEVTRPSDAVDAASILHHAGYENLGSGSYAQVWAKPDEKYVLKLFDLKDRCYMAFVDYIQRHPNPHFPKVKGKLIRVNDQYGAVRLERLIPYPINHKLSVTIMNYAWWYYATLNGFDKERDSRIEDFERGYPSVAETIRAVYDFGHATGFRCGHDIGGQNLMERPDGEIVIVDPLFTER